jgi:protein-S-isoprenylcysteine O-methyltransferase Ste14
MSPSNAAPVPASSSSAPVSAAEQTRSARLGAILFRNRSWLPVLFIGVPLLVPAPMSLLGWVVGAIFIIAGEWIRLAGVAAAGTVTRRRSRTVQRLVRYGVFAWVRNPLYVGNFLIWMGFTIISGVLWFLPIAILLFAVEYSLIVRYEEGVLESIFGGEYLAYKRSTPRWIPRPPQQAESGTHEWREAWRSEVSTFLQYATLVLLFVLKQLWEAQMAA